MKFVNMGVMKMVEKFVPDADIEIDKEHSLQQISSKFQSVNEGLPELIKNSKDNYARINISDREDRQILVLISRDGLNLGVIDLGGATKEDFEEWKTWSSRKANRLELSKDIEAGYGNGGKSFMVRGCTLQATMCGYLNGMITKRGFINDDPELSFKAVTFMDENQNKLNNHPNSDYKKLFEKELKPFGVKLSDLPISIKKALDRRKAFTVVTLKDLKEWKDKAPVYKRRRIGQIPDLLMKHGQAALTIETCNVWVQHGKNLLRQEPLSVSDFKPLNGFEDIPKIPVPRTLTDPDTDEKIDTGISDESSNYLELKSSKENLRLTLKNKARNVIRVGNERNIVASWSIADLVPMQSSSFIYGTLKCDKLTEEYLAGSDRSELADTTFTKALKYWTGKRVKELSSEISDKQAEENSKEDSSSEAQDTMKQLRELMRQHLELADVGGEGSDGTSGRPTISKNNYGKRVDEIVLEQGASDISFIAGTTVPLKVSCYEIKDNQKLPISNPHIKLYADKGGIVANIEDKSLEGLDEGIANIYFQDMDTNVKSNTLRVTVHKIKSMNIEPVERILKQGEGVKLGVRAISEKDLPIEGLIYQVEIDESEMGTLSRTGFFRAGGYSGLVTVRIKYGIKDSQYAVSKLEIGEERIKTKGGNDGSDIPYILLCGMPAPGFESLPESQRTEQGGTDYPTIIDFDPRWENKVIWLNQKSVESKRVRRIGNRGFGDMLKVTHKTYKEFLALKCFEILKRLKLRIKIADSLYAYPEYLEELAQAEIETSEFLQAAFDLVDKIGTGGGDE